MTEIMLGVLAAIVVSTLFAVMGELKRNYQIGVAIGIYVGMRISKPDGSPDETIEDVLRVLSNSSKSIRRHLEKAQVEYEIAEILERNRDD